MANAVTVTCCRCKLSARITMPTIPCANYYRTHAGWATCRIRSICTEQLLNAEAKKESRRPPKQGASQNTPGGCLVLWRKLPLESTGATSVTEAPRLVLEADHAAVALWK